MAKNNFCDTKEKYWYFTPLREGLTANSGLQRTIAQ